MPAIFHKLQAYLRTVAVTRHANVRGIPFLPRIAGSWHPHNRQAFNSFITEIHSLRLENPRLIVDAGANHGDFSLAASTLHPPAKVILFEPLQFLHEGLAEKSRSIVAEWEISPCALSSETGETTIYIDPSQDTIGSLNGPSQTYREANAAASEPRRETCRTITLDEFTSQSEIASIDLLKIDVEGWELEVLRGAERALGFTRSVFVEASLIRGDLPYNGQHLVDVVEILTKSGFKILRIDPSFYFEGEQGIPAEFNILARR